MKLLAGLLMKLEARGSELAIDWGCRSVLGLAGRVPLEAAD